jgi:hypothetical protein
LPEAVDESYNPPSQIVVGNQQDELQQPNLALADQSHTHGIGEPELDDYSQITNVETSREEIFFRQTLKLSLVPERYSEVLKCVNLFTLVFSQFINT